MTLSFPFFLALLLLQVLTLYFVVCLTCDMRRHDSRLDRVGKTVDGLAHRVHMLQDGAEMAVRRLDDVTQAVKDMDGGLEALGRQLGTPVVPGVPDILGRGFLPDERREHTPPLEFRDPVPPCDITAKLSALMGDATVRPIDPHLAERALFPVRFSEEKPAPSLYGSAESGENGPDAPIVPVAQYWGSSEDGVTGPDGYFVPRSQYPGTAPHVTFAEGGGHD